LTLRRVFIDTTALANAFGGPSVQRAASRGIVLRASHDELVLHASVEAVQEFLFHRIGRSGRRAASEAHGQ
jgi:hypothetical protein